MWRAARRRRGAEIYLDFFFLQTKQKKKKTQKSVCKSDGSCVALSRGSRSSVDSANPGGGDGSGDSEHELICVHSAGATDLSACHRVNGKKKKNYCGAFCSFLFLSAAQSPMSRSKFLPVPERRCQEWKKG